MRQTEVEDLVEGAVAVSALLAVSPTGHVVPDTKWVFVKRK